MKTLRGFVFAVLVLAFAACDLTPPPTCTVSFDANGGNAVAPISAASGAAITLPAATRSGWILNGWYSAAGGGTRIGAAGDSYTVTETLTLHAQWTQAGAPCTVTFLGNGGNNPAPVNTVSGAVITLPATVRAGYGLRGWYSAAGGGTRIGAAGDSYTVTGTATLYAQWTKELETTGRLTITGIDPVYNGLWAIVIFKEGTTHQIRGERFFENGEEKGVQISGGRVVLPVFRQSTSDWKLEPYTGTGTVTTVYLKILSQELHYKGSLQSTDIGVGRLATVNFANGAGTLANPVVDRASGVHSGPKALEITGISEALVAQGKNGGIKIGIFPAGTTPQQALTQTGIVAGASSDDGSVSISAGPAPCTATAQLYAAPFTPVTRWTVSGIRDLYLVLGGSTYYRKQNVAFFSATTTLDAADFQPVSPDSP